MDPQIHPYSGPLRPLDRRRFLALGGLGLGALPFSMRSLAARVETLDARVLPPDDFWQEMRALYATRPDVILLDNAALGMTAQPVADRAASVAALRRHGNAVAAETWMDGFDVAEQRVADLLGTDFEETVTVRNATEALDTVLMGVPLSPGDEVLYSSHEYQDMVDVIHQRAEREGIVPKAAILPEGRAVSDGDIVAAFEAALSPKTRLVLVSHVSTWNGRVLPVAAITEAAHAQGAEVLVDGAQALGLVPTNLADIGCDYYGASLHKWLGAATGTGVLFIQKEKLGKVWPLFGYRAEERESKAKFYSHAGTVDQSAFMTIMDALDLHARIGQARLRERLVSLTGRWSEHLADVPGVRLLHPADARQQAGFGSFALDAIPSAALQKWLWDRHRIETQSKAIWRSPYPNALRVSPGAFTTTDEIDRFVAAVREAAATPQAVVAAAEAK